jgi:hypothetical protein
MFKRTDSIARLENTEDRTPRQDALLAELKDVEAASKRTDDLDRRARERD